MTTSAELGERFTKLLLLSEKPDPYQCNYVGSDGTIDGHWNFTEIGFAVLETVKPYIRAAIDNSDSTPIATVQHVDELMLAIMRELGWTEES